MNIRPATDADLDAIVALERSIENAPHWPRSSYARILDSSSCDAVVRRLYIAEDCSSGSPRLVGFAVAARMSHDPEAAGELESIAISLPVRRVGIGRALTLAVLDWMRSEGASEIELEVRASNSAATALYVALGFKEAGRRRKYYKDPEDDAILMRLRLDKAK